MTVECPSLCTHQSHHPKIQNVVTSMACPPRFVAAHSKIYPFLTNVPSRYLGDSILKLDVNVSPPLPCNSESKKLFQHDGIICAPQSRASQNTTSTGTCLSPALNRRYIKSHCYFANSSTSSNQIQNDRRMIRCSPRLDDGHSKKKNGSHPCPSFALGHLNKSFTLPRLLCHFLFSKSIKNRNEIIDVLRVSKSLIPKSRHGGLHVLLLLSIADT
jgi:hypothetical protein